MCGGGVINILYPWKSKGLYRIWWLWHLWGVCVGGVSSISCIPGSQKACIGYGGCVICGVCVWGGVINILYPWKSKGLYRIWWLWHLWGVCVGGGGCHQYPVSLEVNRRTSYIPSVYFLQYLYFYLFLNIHKSTKLGSKYSTSLVVKCQISHTTSSRKANISQP